MLSPDVGAVRHGSAAVADHTVLFFLTKNIVFRFFYFVFFVNNKLHFINFAFNYSFSKVRTMR